MTLDVSHFDTSRDSSDEHPENMNPKLLASEILSPSKSAEVRFEQSSNMRSQVFALTPRSICTDRIEFLKLPQGGLYPSL